MTMIFLALLCIPGNVYDEFLERGNDAYVDNRLDDAIQAYEELVASGVESGPVFYNLASAYYHSGDPGRAVLNYERALAVDPDYSPAMRGLESVAITSPRLSELPAGFRSKWAHYFERWKAWATLPLLVLWWGFWGILLLAVWKPTPRLRALSIAFTCVVVLLAGLSWVAAQSPQGGVVLAKESPLRYGPDERDSIRAHVRAGDRVCIEHAAGLWVRVETVAGARGWMRRADLAWVTRSVAR